MVVGLEALALLLHIGLVGKRHGHNLADRGPRQLAHRDHPALLAHRAKIPRGRLVRAGVRVAEELGADLIKTNYTGDPDSFRQITAACSVPVLIAGGEKGGDLETLMTIRDAVDAGAAGVCMGRNAFQRDDTARFVAAVCRVVHEGVSPTEALETAK